MNKFAVVAQLVEQSIRNRQVRGSNPLNSKFLLNTFLFHLLSIRNNIAIIGFRLKM